MKSENNKQVKSKHNVSIGNVSEKSQHDQTIVVNATQDVLNTLTKNAFYVNPIRNVNGSSNITLFYNPETKEVTYGGALQSSLRYKTNVQDLSEEFANNILNLRPVTFEFVETNVPSFGLIAEEVLDYYPESIMRNALDNDVLEGISYDILISPLIKFVQKQNEVINNLENRVATLESALIV